jgi:carboxyl-terminal processing protease
MSKDRFWLFRPWVSASVMLVAGIFLGAGIANKGRSREEDQILINSIKFRELLSIIHTDYIDPTNTDSLADAALESIVEELDPHSSYLSKKDAFSNNAQLESNFEGIGAEFQFIDDTIWVSGVVKNGPSDKAGLRAGDKILTVNKTPISGVSISHQDLTRVVRGPKGTVAQVNILRNKQLMPLTVTRDRIQSRSVDYYDMFNPMSGYIKCSRFTHSTAMEIREALMDLISRGMKSLILDLRDNSGGYVSSAVKVADEFLKDKSLIVYTEGRNPAYNAKTFATSSGLFESGNLVVLINENTASAAEIVTGALQDHDRALIMGRRSFGKGLVQAPITLTDGSEVRLTISRYFTPSGRCIQKGYQRRKRQAYFKEFEQRARNGEFFNSDSIAVTGKPSFKTQSGRRVWGGGGIIPDVFVSKDSLFQNDRISRIIEKPVLHAFILKFYNQNPKRWEQFERQSFSAQFELQEEDLSLLQKHLTEFGIQTSHKDFDRMKPTLELYVKAGLAKCLWHYDGFYSVLASEDKELKKASFYAPRSQRTLQTLATGKNPKKQDASSH